MKPLTPEWIKRAEGDWSCVRLFADTRQNGPPYDVCFYAKQCAENYLKAYLQEASVRFNKVHDLTALLDLALPTAPDWNTLRPALDVLNPYTMEIRYPGYYITGENAEEAYKLCEEVRAVVRISLGLSV